MQQAIQPTFNVTTVTCACGNSFETGSVKGSLRVEICSACHPFFTGKQKFIDAGGRVDRFKRNTVSNGLPQVIVIRAFCDCRGLFCNNVYLLFMRP